MILDSNLDIGVTYDSLHLTATFLGEEWIQVSRRELLTRNMVHLVARAGRYYFYLAYDRNTSSEITPDRYFIIL